MDQWRQHLHLLEKTSFCTWTPWTPRIYTTMSSICARCTGLLRIGVPFQKQTLDTSRLNCTSSNWKKHSSILGKRSIFEIDWFMAKLWFCIKKWRCTWGIRQKHPYFEHTLKGLKLLELFRRVKQNVWHTPFLSKLFGPRFNSIVSFYHNSLSIPRFSIVTLA